MVILNYELLLRIEVIQVLETLVCSVQLFIKYLRLLHATVSETAPYLIYLR